MSNQAYLEAAERQHDELRNKIDGLRKTALDEDRPLSDSEMAQVRTDGEQLKQRANEVAYYREQIEREEKTREMRAALSGDAGDQGPSVGPLMPARGHVSELLRASRDTTNTRVNTVTAPADHSRSTVELGDAGTPAATFERSPLEPRRLATAVNLPVERVVGTPNVPFPRFKDGEAEQTDEGDEKAEYDNIEDGSAQPKVIAVWTDYTQQTQWTLPTFEQRLSTKLARLIAAREDKLLVKTVLDTSGIQSYDASSDEDYSDSLLAAAGKVLGSDVGAEPDLAVIHPDDVVNVFGGSYGTSGEKPTEALRLNLHGMMVYVSNAVDSGKALVGAWATCSKFLDGLGGVNYVLDSLTGLKNNKLTLLGEEAVNIAVDEPAGFCEVDFDSDDD